MIQHGVAIIMKTNAAILTILPGLLVDLFAFLLLRHRSHKAKLPAKNGNITSMSATALGRAPSSRIPLIKCGTSITHSINTDASIPRRLIAIRLFILIIDKSHSHYLNKVLFIAIISGCVILRITSIVSNRCSDGSSYSQPNGHCHTKPGHKTNSECNST